MSERLEIRKVRGKLVPCNGCKRRPTCPIYFDTTRHFLRSGMGKVSNVLNYCEIYLPGKVDKWKSKYQKAIGE